ncbi:MAG: tetratricopeptide repeat protein [Bacteroidales bacterium]
MKPNTSFRPIFTASILLFFIFATAYPQGEERLKAVFVEAESYFLFEEFRDALPLYQRILVADPDNFNINYKIGICYLNDVYQVQKSISYLEKAVTGISSSSKPTSFKERQAPPEAYYYLGNAYRANNRLDDAIKAYQQFKLILDPVVYDAALVDEQINACNVAALQQKNPMYFISVNAGEGINDRFEEINPLVSGDEKIMVFTRKLQFYDAVFYCRRDNGKWSEPLNLTPFFGLDGNSYCTGLSYNGDEIFVYRSDNFDGNLYSSKFKNGKWSKLEKLNGNINTKYWESHASLSKDGRTLYFTSNREGGYGGLDIYRSERSRGSDWGPAINLGPVINSRFNEDTPFVTDDGSTIYFSSMGHYNMGGYDIFYSTKLDDGQWAKPVNAGYPLNTTQDDLFFFPVRDGAYAYYSKYNPADSYGMMDIYKLEVFTDLHPRKFILNGITRINGQVSPDYAKLTATLVNSKTGKIVDHTRINSDGSYTLNAISGDFDLQIKGEGVADHSEKISIPLNNPSNIYALSSVLTASSSETHAEEIAQVQKNEPVTGPEMIVPVAAYNVTTNESIPIRLDLEKNTRLTVLTMLDSKPLKTENFDIKRRKFVYMLTPEPGVNTLRFTLRNSNGDSTVREVTVVYTPAVDEQAVIPTTKLTVLSDSDRYMGVSAMADGKLREFLNNLNLHEMNFKSAADLYDYLLKNAEEHGYSTKEIEALMSRFLSQKDLNLFYEELQDNSPDSLASSLARMNLKANNIYSSDALLDYLFKNSTSGNYSVDDLRNVLYKIASLNRDPLELIRLLESYSTGDLSAYLAQMRQNQKLYPDSRSVADNIMKGLLNNEFSADLLESALALAATDINVHFLSQSLIFISSDNLKQTLLDLDMDQQKIWNSQQLISYLLENADTRKYSKREVLENIEKVRRDPYYFVDLFRKMLLENATGSLKEFLQEMDIRNLKLNTFEELLQYLLNQSQFNDYNREMVYQLLIDIISPRNVEEFISLLKQFADERIIRAIDAADAQQFSKPLEVMQYLLSVADQYEYTEKDLLRLLLKMVLMKGPDAGSSDVRHGLFSGIERPVLVTSLVIVNLVIIILLILFILRKKRKNE